MKKIYSLSEIKDKTIPVFIDHGIKKAVLFGSYAKHSATENSDVDLVVDSGLKGLAFVGFSEDLRNSLGIDIDLFDITHIDKNSPIERELSRTGIVVYEK